MTLFKTVGQMPCLRRYFLSRWYNIQYKTGKYIYFKLLWSHMQKDFFEITDRTKLDYFKKLRYTCRPHTAHRQNSRPDSGFGSEKTPCSRRSIVRLYTLFKTRDPENHTLFRGTYPYRPNKGGHPPSPPPPPTPGLILLLCL